MATTNPAAPFRPLIERWDGTSWAIVSSPNTSATVENILSGVTCASASNCWAVGDYSTSNVIFQTLIERWDGTSWAIVSSPNILAAQSNRLLGVTCVPASDCWAVGNDYVNGSASQTLVERWDGTSWTIVSSPNILAARDNVLYGLTCVSASDCWAVGYSLNGSVYQTLIERWDGTAWAVVGSPNISPTRPNGLYGVTCVSTSDCWAIGYYRNDSNVQTLIERWDGTSWAIVSSPNTSTTQDNVLYGVTCVSASDCWAVGYYVNGSNAQTLVERWDGTSWAIVSSPNTSATQDNVLLGVTCVSASNCWAVGYYVNGSNAQTLIERWDGTSWAIVSSPNTNATQFNILRSVTCVSGVGLLGRRLLHRQRRSDPDRALGRDVVGHRHLAQQQPQRHYLCYKWKASGLYADQPPLWRDVRVGIRVLGRRLLHRQRRSDPDRALGRDLVGHR